jgi:diguanylate cyclase (GGDEF)-like protein/PAS domain S-box-containing protein
MTTVVTENKIPFIVGKFEKPELVIQETETTPLDGEELYRNLVESVTDVIYSLTEDGTITSLNPAFEKLTGWSRSEWIGRSFIGMVHPEDIPQVMEKFQEVLKGEVPPPSDSRFLSKSGEELVGEFTCTPKVKDGRVVGGLGVIRDVTRRRHSDELMERSRDAAKRLAQARGILSEVGRMIHSTFNLEEVYERIALEVRSLLPFDRMAIDLVDEEGERVIVRYSAGISVPSRQPGDVFSLAGSATEVVTRTRSGLMIQTEDREELESLFPALVPAFEAGIRSMVMIPLLSKEKVIGVLLFQSTQPKAYSDQEMKLAESVGSLFEGAISKIQLFTERIRVEEELREIEARYKALFCRTLYCIYIHDLEGRFLDINEATLNLLEYSREEILSLRLSSIIREEHWPSVQKTLEEIQENGSQKNSVECKFRKKTGEEVWVEVEASLLHREGKPYAIQGIARNITVRKKGEEELRALSLVDELTHLYNRRGFFTLGEQQLKIAHRMKKEMLLLFADVDHLKWINDNLGHPEGDLALIDTANILRETFRDSDIIARFGGDEFVVLAIETPEISHEILTTRLQENLKTHNTKGNSLYTLSLSMGVARYTPENPVTFQELLARADAAMYAQKGSRHNAHSNGRTGN